MSYREHELKTISKLLLSRTPLIHILTTGERGVGALFREMPCVSETVIVDARTCGSVTGLMSCILRRLSAIGRSMKSLSESSESETECKKDSLSVKEEVDTPEESTDAYVNKELFSRESALNRSSARLAMERLRAPGKPSKSTKMTKRKLLDDLIDDESDSEYSDSSSVSSSNPGEIDDKSQKGPRNTRVSIETLRVLYRAQNMGVRTPSAFIQKLERILSTTLSSCHQVTLVIDHFESILSADDYDLDPVTKTAGADLLRLISRLNEYIASSAKLSIVIGSCRMLPADITTSCVTVRIPNLSAQQCKQLISQEHPELEPWFINTAVALLYPVFSGNFSLLAETLVRIRRDEQLVRANPDTVVAKTKVVCTQEMRRLFGGGDESEEAQAKEIYAVKRETKWLSQIEKLTLLAGYLAAHNPPNQDKVLFRTVGQHSAPAGRKKAGSTNAFKRGKLNADAIHVRAPVPFNLDRLLCIYRYLNGSWEEDADFDSGVAFQRTVRNLVQYGLFKSTASEDWLRSGIKLNCHAPFDLIELVATDVNVKLDEVLYG